MHPSVQSPKHLLVSEEVDIVRPYCGQPQHSQIEVAVLIDENSAVECAAFPCLDGAALDLVTAVAVREAVAPLADADIEGFSLAPSGGGSLCGDQRAVLREQ